MSGAPPGLSAVDPEDPRRSDLSSAFGTSAAGSLRGLLAPRRKTVRSVAPVNSDAHSPASTPDEDIVVQPSRNSPARRPERPPSDGPPAPEASRGSTRTPGRRAPAARVRDRKDVDLLLLAVAREGAASGREFIDLVRERSGGAFVLSERSVYHQLHRLRNERLIRDTGRGGSERFVLTPLGERILAGRVRSWEAFARGVDRVLSPRDPAPGNGTRIRRDGSG